MVASSSADLYTPFPPGHYDDSGPQSSEEGSGLHSPVYDQAYLRYHGHPAGETLPTVPYDSHYALPTARVVADHRFLPALDVPPSPHPPHRPPPPSPERTLLLSFSAPRLPPPNPHTMDYSYSHYDRRLPDPHSSSFHKHQGPPIPSPLPYDSGASSSASRESRKPSSMTVIACRQCRARKIRCDSTRPMCHNCVKRGNECEYDAVPKRRGPDKHPGTRQRSCKKRPSDGGGGGGASKRKRKTGSPERRSPSAGGKSVLESPLLHVSPVAATTSVLELPLPGMIAGEAASHSLKYRRAYDRASPDNIKVPPSPEYAPAPARASQTTTTTTTTTTTWWDELVAQYAPTPEQSVKAIIADLTFLFETTNLLLSFLNLPLLLRTLDDPATRARAQPALVYAALAVSTLLRASEIELREAGRSRALWFRQSAQSALESAWAARWVDEGLAGAALLLAIFESSAHPHHSPERLLHALTSLDTILQTLNLPALDAHDPDVSTFPRGSVPAVFRSARSKTCACRPPAEEHERMAYTWSSTPAWDDAWAEGEVRREECRRLCWSALSLVSEYVARCVLAQEKAPGFWIADPANYKLLFPGEMLSRNPVHNTGESPKESVWALHCRSMLLWNSCQLPRGDSERVEFAIQAWGEAEGISDAIDRHSCNVDTALIYSCREFVYNTRLTVTQTLRRSVPYSEILQGLSSDPNSTFNRKHAEEWFHYQDQLAMRIKAAILHLAEEDGQLLTRRPFCVTWFASQIATCLSLWTRDRGLTHALELAKSFLVPLDVLNALWPCPVQKRKCDDLRKDLEAACGAAGLPAPLSTEYSLPPIIRQ